MIKVAHETDYVYSGAYIAVISCFETGLSIMASSGATLRPLFRKTSQSHISAQPLPLVFEQSSGDSSFSKSGGKEYDIEFSMAFYDTKSTKADGHGQISQSSTVAVNIWDLDWYTSYISARKSIIMPFVCIVTSEILSIWSWLTSRQNSPFFVGMRLMRGLLGSIFESYNLTAPGWWLTALSCPTCGKGEGNGSIIQTYCLDVRVLDLLFYLFCHYSLLAWRHFKNVEDIWKVVAVKKCSLSDISDLNNKE